jgi:PAS domain S-box-containing protein
MNASGFPHGNSAMAAQMRSHDWTGTALGPMEQWPAPLRGAVELMLNAPEGMYLAWGEELTFLYNDAYAPVLGPRREGALGMRLQALWPDAWEAVREPIAAAFRGQPGHFQEVPITLTRLGHPEQTWWTFSFFPIYLEDGRVGGAFCITNEVTDKITSSARTSYEQERLVQLFEQAPMFMAFLSGPEHRIEFTNPGYLRLVEQRQVIGRTVAEALPDAVDQGYLELLDRAYRSGKAYTANGAVYAAQATPGGPRHVHYVDFVFQPIRGQDERVTGVFVQGVDVTDRTLSEQAIRAMDIRNRQILDSAMDYAIIATDAHGRVTRWNEGARLIMGWCEQEMLGQTAARFFTPEDVAGGRLALEMETALASGRCADERWHLRKSGERFWAKGSMTVLRDEHGAAAGFVKVLRDRTAERLASAALADSERRLAALVGASSEALYSINADWSQMRQLAAADALAPVTAPTAFWLEKYIPADAQPALMAAVARAVRSRQPLNIEHRVIRQDGSLGWCLSRVVPLRDDDGQVSGWFGAASDITARRAAEEQLRELTASLEQRVRERTAELLLAEEKLRQSQKMEAVGQLTGGLAHDFNNLLTAVTMGLELVQMRIDEGNYDRLGRYLDMARSGATRAAALTQRLLAFSRRQTLAPTVLDLNLLVGNMEEIIRRTLGPSIQMQVVLASDPWSVMADVSQLESALLNLCINARDAMPDGGRLRIETGNRRLDPGQAQALELAAGDYACLSVADTGIGMSEELMAKVFEPFFTTKPIGQGTGLGLSMIYGFMRQSGGQVRMQSAPGQGTTMSLYLPRSIGAEVALTVAAEAEAPPAPVKAAPRVLLVEDEAPVRILMSDVLTGAGYQVTGVAEGVAAVERLRSDEVIDLLITDVGLTGGLNGRQVADAGRQSRPGLPVLFVTGYAANAAIGAGQLERGMEVLTKPFKAVELERRVAQILRAG